MPVDAPANVATGTLIEPHVDFAKFPANDLVSVPALEIDAISSEIALENKDYS